ncbi:hypothetical protein D6827_01685 [Candidatus Parcubacteria bacterium]|nr:MAG: hypothetical protein D6827_01685 [Candidatus Parcubacteria bacterium]
MLTWPATSQLQRSWIMTRSSEDFVDLEIDKIKINRDERQRRELSNIAELAHSIETIGLLNPIVVDKNTMQLIAGERRLEAHKLLERKTIKAHLIDAETEIDQFLAEFEENSRRNALTWQEENDAIVKFHKKQTALDPKWTTIKTAERLNLSKSVLSKHLTVWEYRQTADAEIINSQPSMNKAYMLAQQKEKEKHIKFIEEKLDPAPKQRPAIPPAEAIPPKLQPEPIMKPKDNVLTPPKFMKQKSAVADDDILNSLDLGLDKPKIHIEPSELFEATPFGEWAKHPQEIPFDFVHATPKPPRSDTAADDPFYSFLTTLITHQDNFIAPAAHLMLWVDPAHYARTAEYLRSAGWTIFPYPLIWHISHGPYPCAQGRYFPQMSYRMAIVGMRGNKKLARSFSASVACNPPSVNPQSDEIPFDVLQHFFDMFIDNETNFVDLRIRGINSIKAAQSLGPARVLALESDLYYYNAYVELLEKADAK